MFNYFPTRHRLTGALILQEQSPIIQNPDVAIPSNNFDFIPRPIKRIFPIFLAIFLLTFLWVLFFWRILTPTPQDRLIFEPGDFTQHYYAFADYQVERINQGQFPLWNPYNHSGDPFAGNIQFAAFYPPRYLMAALVGRDGWSIEDYQLEVALHYWLASLLMFAFLRIMTGRTSLAFFGSILYAYSGYLTGYPLLQVSVLESAIWLPLMMLGAHLSVTRPGWWLTGGILGGIGIACSLFGGHPQTTMQLTYLTIAYLAFTGYQYGLNLFQIIIRLAILGLTGAGLSAIQLLPALEFTKLSYRVTDYGYADKANGFLPSDLFQVAAPGLFGTWSPLYLGASGILLALGAALRPRLTTLFWGTIIVIGLLLSLGSNSIVYDFFYLIVPGFGVFRQQERIASVISFALIMLACDQLGWLLNRDPEADTQRQFQRYGYILYGYAGVITLIGIITISISLFQARTGDAALL
ncbi:MAG TPA: YfhO family protein, partial [Phototrophicaceae bacterium]|nr:YfhO family protein [Phototrophicaceae bacterium]